MASDQSRQMWKAGVALSDAWLHFAAEALRREHESKPGVAGTLDQLVTVAGSTRDGKRILAALQAVGNAHLAQMESSKLLQEALLEVLAGDGLIATGYNGAGSPVMIDAAIFADAEPDWENSHIRVNDTVYRRVRITDPANIPVKAKAAKPKPAARAKPADAAKAVSKPKKTKAVIVTPPVEALPEPVETPTVPKPAVRSRASENIRAAIDRLMQDDSHFGELTRKHAAQMIRDRIGATYEKGNGLSDPNLARHIRKTCGPKLVRNRTA